MGAPSGPTWQFLNAAERRRQYKVSLPQCGTQLIALPVPPSIQLFKPTVADPVHLKVCRVLAGGTWLRLVLLIDRVYFGEKSNEVGQTNEKWINA